MKFSRKLIISLIILAAGVFLVALFILTGNSANLFNASLSLLPQKINNSVIIKPVLEDPIQTLINTPVPTTPVVEKIVFAVNKDFADQYPDWKTRADRIVADVNTGFAQTTQKRFEIGKYITYEFNEKQPPFNSIEALTSNPASYVVPNKTNNVVLPQKISCNTGRLLIYLVAGDDVTLESPSGGNYYSPSNDSVFGFAIIYERKTKSTLLKEDYPYMDDLESTYWNALKMVAHELGHSLGLAIPEWYNYEYEDLTSVPPTLLPYSLNAMYPFDPQANVGGSPIIHYPDKLWKFSDLNSFIINHGLCRGITMEQIKSATANTIIVRVKDIAGNIVKNATVNFVLKQSVQTDDTGNATIKTPKDLTLTPPIAGNFDSEIVKVSKNGKYGGDYLTTYDLQRTRLLNNKNIHYLDIVIR
jgi:hypothetical protein